MSEITQIGKRTAAFNDAPALPPLVPQPYTLAELARRALYSASRRGRK